MHGCSAERSGLKRKLQTYYTDIDYSISSFDAPHESDDKSRLATVQVLEGQQLVRRAEDAEQVDEASRQRGAERLGWSFELNSPI